MWEWTHLVLIFFLPLVSGTRTINVHRGLSYIFTPHDLDIDTSRDDACKIRVENDEPMVQRVGKMKPKMFDCNFALDTVQYIHNGSPLLDFDQIKLHVHHFSGEETTSETLIIYVNIMEAEYSILQNNGLLRPVHVDEFYGFSIPLDFTVLQFRYNYYAGAKCTISYSRNRMNFPLVGHMTKGADNKVVYDFQHDCREFLYMGYRYQHLAPPTPNLDYLPLTVKVFDPAHERVMIENLYLPVNIRNAFPNSVPTLRTVDVYNMEVDYNAFVTIPAGVLLADDEETPQEWLVFNITSQLGPGDGYFVNMLSHTERISSFMVRDLMTHLIAYHPPRMVEQQRNIDVEFTVFDTHFARSDPATLKISLTPKNLDGPIVTKCTGLTLLEGQIRPITTQHLQVMDTSSSYSLRFLIKSGLRHGSLTINGSKVDEFSMPDLQYGRLFYHHDDSDSKEDKIILRVTDRKNTIRIKFPITILPMDDSPPYLMNNRPVNVGFGHSVQITHKMLSAHDKDSLDSQITYIMRSQPTEGRLVKKYYPMAKGQVIDSFHQYDIDEGFIYYEHIGKHDEIMDAFEIILYDTHDPPNKSGKYLINVHINPIDVTPPHQMAGTSRSMMVEETDVAYISKDHLQYVGIAHSDDMLYTVTAQPFFPASTITIDAGRLILTKNLTYLYKNPDIVPVHTFHQSDINQGRIAYMPPMEDIGPIRRHARVIFTVTDADGNTATDQTFDITILPVNNQVPHVSVGVLKVVQGSSVGLREEDVGIYDPDTDERELRFFLEEEPLYGVFLNEDVRMVTGSHFYMEDVRAGKIRYEQDGSDEEEDVATFSITDGINIVTEDVKLSIHLLHDQPRLAPSDGKHKIEVYEDSTATITTTNLEILDNDTEDLELIFTLIQSPQFGDILVNGQPTQQFSKKDLWNGMVTYVHNGAEVGMYEKYDVASFTLSDRKLGKLLDGVVIDLNVTILPVNNAKPVVIVGGIIFVTEGDSATINHEVLSVQDLDTPPERLTFLITKQPNWGVVTTIDPKNILTGEYKPLTKFSMNDVIRGVVRYVQTNHTNVEPFSDIFDVHASDGKFISSNVAVHVTILPNNDEAPLLTVKDIEMMEGEEVVLDHNVLSAKDLDIPKQRLILSILEYPGHGKLSLEMHSESDGKYEVPVNDVNFEEIEKSMRLLYRHDGSENFRDRFTIQISDGRYKVSRQINVRVKPMNDENPVLIKNMGAQINFGDRVYINKDFLQATDPDNIDRDIIFTVIATTEKGTLEFYNSTGELQSSPDTYGFMNDQVNNDDGAVNWIQLDAGMVFTQEDLNKNRLRYVQNSPEVDETETDKFIFQLSDKKHDLPNDMFQIEILNPDIEQLAVLSKGIDVTEGDSKILTTSVLSASDNDRSKPQEIKYVVTELPRHGHLAIITNKETPISNFTQLDLMAQKVVYTHTSNDDITEDVFHFTVTNSFLYTRTATFHIHIKSLDRIFPTLDTNVPLTVVQGQRAQLTSYNLHIHDPDTPTHNLTYRIIEPPILGKLLNRDVLIKDHKFSQYDIDNNFITYLSEDTDERGIDYFLFAISDGRHDGYLINGTMETKPAFFNILVQPLSKEPPRLINNQGPDLLEQLGANKYGFLLDSKNLRAIHPMSDSSEIMYTVLTKPQHGYLQLMNSGKVVKKRFSQRDLDQSDLQYILDGDVTDAYNDSFVFRVQDKRKNTLDGQRFDLAWSVIEFTEPQYIVCEDAGTMMINLVRRGSTKGPAYVDIRARGMSAKGGGVDFQTVDVDQIQFNPGETEVPYSLHIKNDGNQEANEKFRIVLKSPLNAILGDNDKVSVQIIDYRDGECEDYIGMIRKTEEPKPAPRPTQRAEPPTEEISIFNQYDDDDDPLVIAEPESDRDKDDIRPHPLRSEHLTFDENTDRDLNPQDFLDFDSSEEREEADKPKRRGSKNKNKNKDKNRNKKKDNEEEELQLPEEIPSILAPKACTTETNGLLFFDRPTGLIYICNGWQWEPWVDKAGLVDSPKETPLTSRNQESPDQRRPPPYPKPPKRNRNCDPGWSSYRGDCYKLMSKRGKWEESEALCQTVDAHLAHVVTDKHNDWLWKLAGEQTFWIGLNDKSSPHQWRYTSGEPVRVLKWKQHFPRFQPNLRKNCVLVTSDHEWVNRKCSQNDASFICVKPNRSKMEKRRRRFSYKVH